MIKKIFLIISLSILIQTDSIGQYWRTDYILDFFECNGLKEYSEINNNRYACPDFKKNGWGSRYVWEREYQQLSDSNKLWNLRIIRERNVEITFFKETDTAILSEVFEYIKSNPRIQFLSLKGKIKKLPKDLSPLINLRGLELYIDKLESIPASIGLLKNLKVLTIAGEKYCNPIINTIPVELNQLSELRYVSIDASNLDTIPSGTFDLDKLSHLEIRSEKLTYLEVPFSKIPHISHLMLFLSEAEIKTKPGNKNSFILYSADAYQKCGESSMYRDSWNYNTNTFIANFINQSHLVNTYRFLAIDQAPSKYPPIDTNVKIGLFPHWKDDANFNSNNNLLKALYPKNPIESYYFQDDRNELNISVRNDTIDIAFGYWPREHCGVNRLVQYKTYSQELCIVANNEAEENKIVKFIDSLKYLYEQIACIRSVIFLNARNFRYIPSFNYLSCLSNITIKVNSTDEIKEVFKCLGELRNVRIVSIHLTPGPYFKASSIGEVLEIKTLPSTEEFDIYFDSSISFKQMNINIIGSNLLNIHGGLFKKINIFSDSLKHNLDIRFSDLGGCKTINIDGTNTVYNTHLSYYNKQQSPQIYLLNKQNEHGIYLEYAEKLNSTNFRNNVRELSIKCFKTRDLKQLTPLFLRKDIEFDIGKVIISK